MGALFVSARGEGEPAYSLSDDPQGESSGQLTLADRSANKLFRKVELSPLHQPASLKQNSAISTTFTSLEPGELQQHP